jgi:Uma2 family endonuclease
VIRKIVLALVQQIDQPQIGVTLWAPIGLFMPGCDPVQPDILVVRSEDLAMFRDRRIHGVPALLIEVLSPSNSEQDTDIKLGAYARAGVPEYWIVRPAERDVLVYSQPNPRLSNYAQCDHVAAGGELASPTLPFRSTIAEFFADAPDPTV